MGSRFPDAFQRNILLFDFAGAGYSARLPHTQREKRDEGVIGKGRGEGRTSMIALRRAGERHRDHGGAHDVWQTFAPEEGAGELSGGFGLLELFDEGVLARGGRIPRRPISDGELLTYVREGAV